MKILGFERGRSGRSRGRRGSVIVATLVAMTALMTLGAVLYHFASAADGEVGGNKDDRHAFYLAEAGAAEAMIALRGKSPASQVLQANPIDFVGTSASPAYLAGGVFWVTATDLGGNQVRLVSTALAGSGRAALEVVVENEGQAPLFQTVLNSRETLTLNSGVAIDSFDSELGSYASQALNSSNGHTYANDEGDVTSNENVVLNANATVFGDATPGPGYSVSFATGSFVSGSTAPSPKPFAFPPITPPAVASAGPLTIPVGGSQTLASGTYGFDDLTINKAAQLTIQGPATLVVDGFLGGKDARLNIDATLGPVTIFVNGNYTHLANFECQPVGSSPMAVAFMVQGAGDVVFPALTKVRGAYYVPNANVVFANDNEAWGSFAANRIDMSSTMRFHFDESLAKHWSTSGGTKDPLQVLAWRAAAVPGALLSDRRDPFQVLAVSKAALQSPANSWQ